MATWPGMLCFLPSRCISFSRRFEPQVKKASALPCAIRLLEDLFDVLDRAGVVGIEHRDGAGAETLEQLLRHHDAGMARAQDRGDADAVLGRQLRQRRQRRQADAAAEHHEILPGRVELEADAERAGDVEVVARLQHRHAAGAAAFGLVEEFDLARGPVDAVDAHRPAHPDFGAVGRRAEQVKHLAGIGLERVLMHLAARRACIRR